MSERGTGGDDRDDDAVVRLPRDAPAPSTPARPPPRLDLHGVATAGMALCAVIAIVAGIAFLTVGWPGRSGRVVIAIGVGAVLGFLSCTSAAIFTAARDTYARPGRGDRDK